jgi:hypothetical protein
LSESLTLELGSTCRRDPRRAVPRSGAEPRQDRCPSSIAGRPLRTCKVHIGRIAARHLAGNRLPGGVCPAPHSRRVTGDHTVRGNVDCPLGRSLVDRFADPLRPADPLGGLDVIDSLRFSTGDRRSGHLDDNADYTRQTEIHRLHTLAALAIAGRN